MRGVAKEPEKRIVIDLGHILNPRNPRWGAQKTAVPKILGSKIVVIAEPVLDPPLVRPVVVVVHIREVLGQSIFQKILLHLRVRLGTSGKQDLLHFPEAPGRRGAAEIRGGECAILNGFRPEDLIIFDPGGIPDSNPKSCPQIIRHPSFRFFLEADQAGSAVMGDLTPACVERFLQLGSPAMASFIISSLAPRMEFVKGRDTPSLKRATAEGT